MAILSLPVCSPWENPFLFDELGSPQPANPTCPTPIAVRRYQRSHFKRLSGHNQPCTKK